LARSRRHYLRHIDEAQFNQMLRLSVWGMAMMLGIGRRVALERRRRPRLRE